MGNEEANFSFGCVDICLHELRMAFIMCMSIFVREEKYTYIDIFCVCSKYCRVVPTSWLFALDKGSNVQERQDHERRPSH